MTLQILVNHYKENENQIKQFLKSLNIQQGVQFDVLIASDGGDIKLTDELLSGYKFPIQYAYCPHSGVCHTRNILLDKSTADYIMFCDIDDMFWKPDGLKSLMDAAEKTNVDIIGSPYQCEHRLDNGKFVYQAMEKDTLRVHGKIFKREYLVKNNIRFPDEMTFSGDMAFLWLVYSLTNKVAWIKNNFYIWKWNPESVTRKDKFFSIKTYDNTLKCYRILAEDLKKRNLQKTFSNLIATLFSMIYVQVTHPYWKTAPQEYQDNACIAVDDCLRKYYNDYIKIDEETRKIRYGFMLDYVQGKGRSGTFEDMLPWIKNRLGIKENYIMVPDCSNMPDGTILIVKDGKPVWHVLN